MPGSGGRTWTGLRLGGGRQALVALVRPTPAPAPVGSKHPPGKGPDSAPQRLVRVDVDAAGKPQTVEVAVGVPEGAADLAALDLDGDGRGRKPCSVGARPAGPWAPRQCRCSTRLSTAAGSAPRVTRLRSGADARLDARVAGQVTDGAGRDLLCLTAVGRATCLALTDGALQPVGVPLALPVRPTRDRFALDLVSPAVAALPRSATDALALAVGPEAVGGRRLRSRLLGLDGSASEVWSLLPGPEEVVASRYLRLDGLPALAVATLDRAKMNVFGEQRLRVFLLAADRTRAGSPPVLPSRPTATPGSLILSAADQDGDGQSDLVVLSQEGLGGGDLAVLVFRGLGGGRLEAKPMRLSVDNAREAAFSDDVDGDGRRDLVLQDKKSLTVRLAADAAGRRPVGKSPRVTFTAADDGKRQVTVSVGGEGARVDQAPAPAVEEDAGPQVGVSEDGGDDETADEDLTAVGDWVPPVTGRQPLVVLDLDGDGRGEVLRLVSDDEAATRVLVYRLPR